MKKCTLSRIQFQSLLGKLLYLHKCIKPAQIFVKRILAVFGDNPHKKRSKLTNEFHKDVEWVINFLPFFSGSTSIFKPDIHNPQSLHIDACLTGIGVIWNDRAYASPTPAFVHLDLTSHIWR